MPKKKKKSRKAAKPKKKASSAAPRAPAPRSSSNTKWIVGAIVAAVILFLLFSGKQAPEAPMDDAPEAPSDGAAEAEEDYGDEEGRLIPSEVTLVAERTGVRVGAYGKTTWEEGSFFGGIKCLKSTGYRWDVVEFQLTNKEAYPIQLSYATLVGREQKATPTSFTINGRTLRKGVEEACGGDVVEAGKTVTCKFEEPLRHYGPTGKQSANELQIKIRHDTKKTTSQIQFFC